MACFWLKRWAYNRTRRKRSVWKLWSNMRKYGIKKEVRFRRSSSNLPCGRQQENKKTKETKMNLRVLITALALAALTAFAGPAAARAEVEASGSAEVGVFSNYVWRGQRLSEAAAIQPSVTFGLGAFSANLWANYDVDTKEANETDLTLSYSTSFDKAGIELGYIYYALDGVADTQEFYVGLGLDVLLEPSLTLYYDIGEGNGAFLVAAVGHAFELGKGIGLGLGASIGFNVENKIMGNGTDGTAFSGFYNGEFSASLSVPVTKDVSIEPMVAYSYAIGDNAKAAISAASTDGNHNVFWGGVTLAASF